MIWYDTVRRGFVMKNDFNNGITIINPLDIEEAKKYNLPLEGWESVERFRAVLKVAKAFAKFNTLKSNVKQDVNDPLKGVKETTKAIGGVKLDSSQLEFVNSSANHIRLLAPAGSGKTTTLLYRCKYLLETTPKERVLLFTFTRVACEELRQRLQTNEDFAGIRESVVVSTLNAYGNKLIRKKFVGFRQIGTEKKARHFVLMNYLRPVVDKSPIIAANINNKSWVAKSSNVILDVVDTLKTLGFDHKKVMNEDEFRKHLSYLVELGLAPLINSIFSQLVELGFKTSSPNWIYKNFVKFYAAATEMLALQQQFTLEDQKYWGWKSTLESPKTSGKARYAHIMVDEFQDINPIDLFFIAALRERHQATLTLVGDDDQTIFEWRGATPKYILSPGKYILDQGKSIEFKTYILARNYRSPSNIVEIAQRLIAHNKERVKKEVVAVNESRAEIYRKRIVSYDSVVEMLKKDLKNPELKRVAVISRKKSHLIPYQILLCGEGIEFYAAEDLNVMLSDAFNALKGIIKIKQNYLNGKKQSFMTVAEDFLQLCNAVFKYPLRKTEAEALKMYMYSGRYTDLTGAIDHFSRMGGGRVKSIDPSKYILRLRRFVLADTVQSTIKCIAEDFSGLKKDYRKADDDIFYADPPFPELAEFSARYKKNFSRFCQDVELSIASLASIVSSNDNNDIPEEERKKMAAKLCLMTGLRTKGKEFDSVYIIHADFDVWPIKKAVEEKKTESERRLFYVAITRTRKKLTFITDGHAGETPYFSEMSLNNSNSSL